MGRQNPIHYCAAAKDFSAYRDTNPCQAVNGQIRENTEVRLTPCNLSQQRGHLFRHGIYRIGAHGIFGIHQQLRDDHTPNFCVQGLCLNVECSAAQRDQNRVGLVGQLQNFPLVLQDLKASNMWAGDLGNLYLGDHDGAGIGGMEPTALGGQFGPLFSAAYHPGLLAHHGNQIFLPIDHHTADHADGEGIGADDVVNHAVGGLQGQAARLPQKVLLLRGKARRLRYPSLALVHAHSWEICKFIHVASSCPEWVYPPDSGYRSGLCLPYILWDQYIIVASAMPMAATISVMTTVVTKICL